MGKMISGMKDLKNIGTRLIVKRRVFDRRS